MSLVSAFFSGARSWRYRIGSLVCGLLVSWGSYAAEADRVVLVVFDGMRPDFITPQYCPNLYSLATNGVFFRRHHPVFISTTIVNGTALASGSHPGHSGILANSYWHPELDYESPVAAEALNTVRRGDLLTGGHYIAVDTLAELIQKAGHHTVIAGTKAVTLVHDRGVRRHDTPAYSNSVNLFRGVTLPRSALEGLKKANDDKDFPNNFTAPNTAADTWTTRALTRGLWKHGVPKFSLLWLSDPDASQHAKGVGSTDALAGIASSDKNLGTVISALKEKGVLDKTDILVVSDHGFSTIERSADIADALRRRGINAHSKMANPEAGDVMVVSLGGAALIYVMDRRDDILRSTVETLQTCDFTGVIFSRLEIEGTFPMSTINYPATTNGPDLIVSMRWSPAPSGDGTPGTIIATGGSRGAGTHGSLSRYDMNNTLVAAGPHFKRGLVSDLPSGNVDIAPTVLTILGVPVPETMDGRSLREAFAHSTEAPPVVHERKLEASRKLGFMHWSQYIKISKVEKTEYCDEGNGRLEFAP